MKFPNQVLLVAVLTATAIFNKSYAQTGVDFDGNDDKIACGNNTSIQITGTAITLEAWIYPTAWKTNVYDGNIICKEDNNNNNGYMLRVGASGRLNFALGNGTKTWSELTTGTLLSLNKWQHIAGTYDGSKMRLYIDGVCVDSVSVSITIGNAATTELLVGAHTTYSRHYQGVLDEIRIWNVCRTETEISKSMNNEFCSTVTGLQLYYKFNQGKPAANNLSKKKTNDISGNGNTGTLTNFTLTGSTSNWVKGYGLSKSVSYGSMKLERCDYFFSPSGKFKWEKSGVYQDTIANYMECDSALTITLTIKKSTSFKYSVHACESYKSPSGLYTWTKPGTYTDYLRNSINCDSIITVVLTIGGGRDTIYPEVCYSYTSPSKKYVWTVSGDYTDTLMSYRNCDSIIDIHLTVNKATESSTKVQVCKSYKSQAGISYTKSGIYKEYYTNYKGCDSTFTINLSVLESSSTIAPVACHSYKSPSSKYVWNKSGTYMDTIYNYIGCDSVITVNLTLKESSNSAFNAISCGPYLSPGKKKIWSVSGKHKDTISNAVGCDSIITVDLTVVKFNTAVVKSGYTLTSGQTTGSFQWLNCSTGMSPVAGATSRAFTPSTDGDYAVELSENGCKDTSACQTVQGLYINGTTGNIAFKLWPNPSQGQLMVTTGKPIPELKVSVIDALGRVILSKIYQNFISEHIVISANPGIYTVILESEGISGRQNIIVSQP